MATGVVQRINFDGGYGFITDDPGAYANIYFKLQYCDPSIDVGDEVEFELREYPDTGKREAWHVRLL